LFRPAIVVWPTHTGWHALLLITIETANLGAVSAQILLQFLGIQAIRDPAEVQDEPTGAREKPAFAEDFNAPVQI
jgi:hypothetical protein